MNDALFCSIHVDTKMSAAALAALVAELIGGTIAHGGVDCAWGRIAVDDDYGDFARRGDPDDFLGWPALLEVMPADASQRDVVVPAVAALMASLIGRGLRVLAQSDYADELPGAGEIAPAAR